MSKSSPVMSVMMIGSGTSVVAWARSLLLDTLPARSVAVRWNSWTPG